MVIPQKGFTVEACPQGVPLSTCFPARDRTTQVSIGLKSSLGGAHTESMRKTTMLDTPLTAPDAGATSLGKLSSRPTIGRPYLKVYLPSEGWILTHPSDESKNWERNIRDGDFSDVDGAT